MKIRYMSDLHNELRKEPLQEVPSVGEDVVVLAGDIDVGVKGILWAQKVFAPRPVVYVLGNHEYYRQQWEGLVDKARATAAGSNVHFLERDEVTIGGIRFLGCSLWADFKLWGAHRQMEAMGAAGRGLNDYHMIKRITRPLRPSESLARHEQSLEWLKARLAENVPTVVVTHHAPTEETSDPKYRGNIINCAYHSKLDHLIAPPVLAWIHGHTHYSLHHEINGVPVLVNTHGYQGYYEDPKFSWNACIEVTP